MQLATENTEKHIDSKTGTISFYDFCALFYKIELNYFNKIIREHRGLLEIRSLLKVKNTSVNSVVLFKCIFWINLLLSHKLQCGPF